ncbi:MAG: hypothetical protein ACM3N4_02250, partial [Nitrososphaerota archaeon]
MSAGEREAQVNDVHGPNDTNDTNGTDDWSDPASLDSIGSSDMPHGDSSGSAPDDTSDDESAVALHITSLRPETRALSLRRLLNVASLVVALALVLALAIAWLPGVLSQRPGDRPAQSTHVASNGIAAARGTNWQSIGPGWAQDITFDSFDTIGYVCGALGPGNAPVLVSRFDTGIVRANTWQTFTMPAIGNHCQIAVSPMDANDVAISIDDCPMANTGSCSAGYPISRVYRSHDGGASWSELPLPAPLAVNGFAWANSTLFVRVWGQMEGGQAAATADNRANASAHLLVSQNDEPFTEISAKSLVGKATRFDYIALFSSGQTLYAALNTTPCASDCLTIVHTNDNGVHWIEHSTSYAGRPIAPTAAQPNSPVLIGWVFRQSDQMTVLLRSFDYGEHWQLLPELPTNPATGGITVFATPDGTLYVASYGSASVVYELRAGERTWRTVGAMPTGMPIAVQYNAAGQAIALWGQAREWSMGSAPP